MQIPGEVKIGYKDYNVNLVDGDVIDDSKVCYGNIKFNEGNINISNLYSEDQKKCTFIHECLHGIDDIMEINLNEEQVRKLGKGIYQFIKDNPNIFIDNCVLNNDSYVVKFNNNINVSEIAEEATEKLRNSLQSDK